MERQLTKMQAAIKDRLETGFRKWNSGYESWLEWCNTAESYHHAYDEKAVKEGATYDEWKFADDAVYFSPYFGMGLIKLKTHPISVKASATMEAKAYSLRFPDWGPEEFKCWPADNGFTMKTLFSRHTKDGKK